MSIETTVILFTAISSVSTAVIACLTFINYKLTQEVKELQLSSVAATIYASRNPGDVFRARIAGRP